MKKLIAGISVFALLALAFPVQSAEDTEGITATVTPGVVSVILSTNSIAYSTLPLSTSDGVRSTALSGTITATNNGTVTEELNITGSNATGGTTPWTLNFSPANTGTVGADQFVHRFDADATFTEGTANALSTSYLTLNASLAALGTQDFELQMNMPTSTTVTDQKSTTVTVQAVAP